MQTFITGIPPVRRNRLWLHRRSLPILDEIHPPLWWRLPDLHAICTRSASLLHIRELRCCDKGQGSQGRFGDVDGIARLRQAGAFLLKSKPSELYLSLWGASAE